MKKSLSSIALFSGVIFYWLAFSSLAEDISDELEPDPEPKFQQPEAIPEWPIKMSAVPQKFDWILLINGELLGGDVISMHQDSLEFDSDELGTISIDMKDILQVRTRTIMSIRLDDNSVDEGQLFISEDKVNFIDKPGIYYPRNKLLAIAPSALSGESLWNGGVSVGLNFKSGNSERFDYTVQVNAERLTSRDRVLMQYTGIFSETEDPDTGDTNKTEDNHRFLGSYDWFYSRSIFFRMPTFEYYTDEFKNIAHQINLGVAAGYIVYDNADSKWDVFVGPSVQYTEFEQETEDGEKDDTSPGILLGTTYDRDITDAIEFYLQYSAKIVSEESGSVIQHIETGLDIEVFNDFDIKITAIIDRVEEPIPDGDGEDPDKNDALLIIGLEYSF